MKKLITTLIIITAVSIPVYAGNGKIQDGRTLVPVRGVFEQLGFKVEWDNDTAKATISDDEHTVSVIRGMSYFKADGKEIYPDVPQQIIDGRFYLPLRAIGDSVGAEIEYDAENKSAKITYGENVSYVTTGSDKFKNTELTWVGETGDCYHRESCHTIQGSARLIPFEQAKAEGRTPCGVCLK